MKTLLRGHPDVRPTPLERPLDNVNLIIDVLICILMRGHPSWKAKSLGRCPWRGSTVSQLTKLFITVIFKSFTSMNFITNTMFDGSKTRSGTKLSTSINYHSSVTESSLLYNNLPHSVACSIQGFARPLTTPLSLGLHLPGINQSLELIKKMIQKSLTIYVEIQNRHTPFEKEKIIG